MPDCAAAHRGHEGVENTDSEGGATCEWLGQVELSVGIIIIILIQELDIAVIHKLSDHWNIGPIHRTFPEVKKSLQQVISKLY